MSKEEEELENGPLLAEILLERLYEQEKEWAREEGRPAPAPYDMEEAKARGLNGAKWCSNGCERCRRRKICRG